MPQISSPLSCHYCPKSRQPVPRLQLQSLIQPTCSNLDGTEWMGQEITLYFFVTQQFFVPQPLIFLLVEECLVSAIFLWIQIYDFHYVLCSSYFLNPDLRLKPCCSMVNIWNSDIAVNDVHWTFSATTRFLLTKDFPLALNSELCTLDGVHSQQCFVKEAVFIWARWKNNDSPKKSNNNRWQLKVWKNYYNTKKSIFWTYSL